MKKLRILAHAQFFGFGPTSLMIAALSAMEKMGASEYEIDVIGSEHLATIKNETKLNVHYLEGPGEGDLLDYLFEIEAHKKYDLFISFYDPTVVLFAWYHDRPVVHYDGLFNVWEINTFEKDIYSDFALLSEIRKAQDVEALKKWHGMLWGKNPHEILFGAHFLSHKQFIRQGERNQDIVKQFPEFASRVTYVGSVINPFVNKIKKHEERTHMLISLGGSLNPIISLEKNMDYLFDVASFISRIRKTSSFKNIPWYFVCHPKLIEQMSESVKNRYEGMRFIASGNQIEYLQLLSGAYGAFLSPGYTAVQEASYFRTAICMLPEQNGGHPMSFAIYQRNNFPTKFSLTSTHHLHNDIPVHGEHAVNEIYEDNKKLLFSEEWAPRMDKLMSEFDATMSDKNAFTALTNEQYDKMGQMTGGYDGAEKIAQGTIEFIEKIKRNLYSRDDKSRITSAGYFSKFGNLY